MNPQRDDAWTPGGDADPGAVAVSALVDGELQSDALSAAIASARHDPAQAERWRHYRVIGDVLRDPHSLALARSDDQAFLARLQGQLGPMQPAQPHPFAVPAQAVGEAANDARFRWKLVAGFASVLAIGVLSWGLWAPQGASVPAGAEIARADNPAAAAQSASPVVADASNPALASTSSPSAALNADPAGAAMLRDPRLDAFLQAHRDAGGLSALHAPAGFLRNATFEVPAR